MPTRRDFLKHSLAAASLFAASGRELHAAPRPVTKRLLILGGTRFLGPALVDSARKRGWTVTLFNRGKSDPHRFPDLETLLGDRDGKLDALKGRSWDAVVDTSGYVPRLVRDSVTLLKDAVKQYVFISTISVYGDTSKPGMDETAPVGKLAPADAGTEKITDGHYGPLKALCEQEAERLMPGRVTNIRPGLIVGPDDPSDRFTYWPVRVERGGEVLAPGAPSDPVLLIDVRDLADWALLMVERSQVGVYNALGPKGTLTVGEMLAACKQASGAKASFTWADAKFLAANKVEAWSDMPVWVPPVGEEAGMGTMSRQRAIAKGLTFRPLVDTARDTLAWWHKLPAERRAKLKAGITPEREAEVLALWHKREQK